MLYGQRAGCRWKLLHEYFGETAGRLRHAATTAGPARRAARRAVRKGDYMGNWVES